MKHLARIQSEYLRYAADQLSWWESMSRQEQEDYLKRHPKSKMRPTPERSKDTHGPEGRQTSYERESPTSMEAKRKHVHKMLRKLLRTPGLGVSHLVDGDGDVKLRPQETARHVGPGMLYSDPPGSNIIKNEGGRLLHETGKFDEHGRHIEHEVKPDEAASILRERLGADDWGSFKEEAPKDEAPDLTDEHTLGSPDSNSMWPGYRGPLRPSKPMVHLNPHQMRTPAHHPMWNRLNVEPGQT